jgi:hypothetical protein
VIIPGGRAVEQIGLGRHVSLAGEVTAGYGCLAVVGAWPRRTLAPA